MRREARSGKEGFSERRLPGSFEGLRVCYYALGACVGVVDCVGDVACSCLGLGAGGHGGGV